MGSYTTNLKLYKPAANEVVDVEQHFNYNWDLCDKNFRRLLEYEYVTTPTPDVVNAVNRSRFYKTYSNSVMAYFNQGGSNFFWQDPSAFVSPWKSIEDFIIGGWFSLDDYPVRYRVIKKPGSSTAEVEWTGAAWSLGDPSTIGSAIQIVPAGVTPTECRPAASKYFMTNAGDTATNYSVARIFFGSSGLINFRRHGVDTAFGGQSRIEFTGIKYNVEVT